VCIPAFTSWPVSRITLYEGTDAFYFASGGGSSDLAIIISWLGYFLFVCLFILLFGDGKTVRNYLFAASILAATVGFTKATIGRAPFLAGGKPSSYIEFRSVILVIKILTMMPLALFVLNSFSPAGTLRNVAKNSRAGDRISRHVAVFFRSFQASIERVILLLEVWMEENPSLLIPRHKADLRSGNHVSIVIYWSTWFMRSIRAWTVACFVNTLEIVPPLVHEAHRAFSHKE
jgi:hypothetical protein